MEEVVRGTKQSPLYIRGHVSTYKKLAFVVDVLDRYWERVCIFDIFVCSYKLPHAEKIRDIVTNPAPALQLFNLSFSPRGNWDAENEAYDPALTEYHWTTFGCKLLKCSWIHNLHTFAIQNSIDYVMSDLLVVLQSMPRLEILRFKTVAWYSTTGCERNEIELDLLVFVTYIFRCSEMFGVALSSSTLLNLRRGEHSVESSEAYCISVRTSHCRGPEPFDDLAPLTKSSTATYFGDEF